MADTAPHVLIIDARFYGELADELVAAAQAELDAAGATHDRISVPGVLELPAALAMALDASEVADGVNYDAFVILGCVIRGETGHYDIVAEQSARALMDMVTVDSLALGNGILTVETMDQAWARASRQGRNNGGAAARAALAMVALRRRFGL